MCPSPLKLHDLHRRNDFAKTRLYAAGVEENPLSIWTVGESAWRIMVSMRKWNGGENCCPER